MAEFENENLKDEEKIGGFDANSPDDETFSLEEKEEYPGELPDFSEEKSSAQSSEVPLEQSYEGVSKAPKIDVPEEGSVWDLFDEEDSKELEVEGPPEPEDDFAGIEVPEESGDDFEFPDIEDESIEIPTNEITDKEEFPEVIADEVSEGIEIPSMEDEIVAETDEPDFSDETESLEDIEEPDNSFPEVNIAEDELSEEVEDTDDILEFDGLEDAAEGIEIPEPIEDVEEYLQAEDEATADDDDDEYELDQFMSEDITEDIDTQVETAETETVEEQPVIEQADEPDTEDEGLDALAADIGATSEDTAEIADDLEGLAEERDTTEDEPVEEEQVPDDTDTDIQAETNEEESSEKRTSLLDLENEEVEVDEDFKDLLKQDLEKSQANRNDRKKKMGARAEEEEETSEEENEEKLKSFVPVDKEEAEEVISLGKFKAKHPSTAGLKDLRKMDLAGDDEEPEVKPARQKKKKAGKKVAPLIPVDTDELAADEKHEDISGKEKDEDIGDEEEKTSGIPWGAVATIAASFVLVSLLTYGTYYIYTDWDWFTGLLKSDNAQVKENIAVVDEPEEDKKETVDKTQQEEPKEEITEPEVNVEDEPEEDIAEQTVEPEITQPERIKKPSTQNYNRPARTANVNRKPQPAASTRTRETVASRDVKKTSSEDVSGVYTVEIYSTPSLEDAEEWLTKLKSRNVSNAFIVAHKKRDKNWYRVRFGAFTSREEAKQEALRLGFAQTWIDRVR